MSSALTPASASAAEPRLALGYPRGDGATEAAIGRAQDGLRAHPDQLEAYVQLATAFVRRARETSRDTYRVYARDVVAAGRERFPADSSLRLLSASLLLDEHAFEAAAGEARILSDLRPSDPTPRLILGDARLELGDYEGATDAYQAAMDLRPDLRSYNRAAYMRWLFGDVDGAHQIMALAVDAGSARDPESLAWCFSDLAAMDLVEGDLDRAAAANERALTLVSDYAPSLVVEARLRARRGELAAGIDALERALSARPSASEYLLLAELQERAGDAEASRAALRRAERLAERDPRPLAAHLARRNEQPRRALELAEAELQRRENIWSWDTLALARLRVGDPHGAAEAIDRALALGTRLPEFMVHRGLVEFALGRGADAQASLDRALAIDPGVEPELVAELRRKLGAS